MLLIIQSCSSEQINNYFEMIYHSNRFSELRH